MSLQPRMALIHMGSSDSLVHGDLRHPRFIAKVQGGEAWVG